MLPVLAAADVSGSPSCGRTPAYSWAHMQPTYTPTLVAGYGTADGLSTSCRWLEHKRQDIEVQGCARGC